MIESLAMTLSPGPQLAPDRRGSNLCSMGPRIIAIALVVVLVLLGDFFKLHMLFEYSVCVVFVVDYLCIHFFLQNKCCFEITYLIRQKCP